MNSKQIWLCTADYLCCEEKSAPRIPVACQSDQGEEATMLVTTHTDMRLEARSLFEMFSLLLGFLPTNFVKIAISCEGKKFA